jgi:cation transport ATPase
MSWFTTLFSGGVDKVISSVGEAADRLITSDEERLVLKNELALISAKAQLDGQKQIIEGEQKLEEEITERWQADMQSDDPAAKKVRPYSLIYMLLFMSIVIITDSINTVGFDVKQAYIDLIEALLVTMVIAYFGSRGLEKWTALRNGKR